MKHIFSIFVLLFSLCCGASETPQPARFEVLAAQSLLLDIVNVNDNFLVAVGERGHILTSTNGQSWQQQMVPVQATLTQVFFIDDKNGWAVGHDATILTTTDGGKSWAIQQYLPNLQRPLFDIIFKDQLHGIAIGAYGLMYRTVDGGNTWSPEFHDELLNEDDRDYLNELKLEDQDAYLDERSSILPHFNRVIIDGRTMFLVGEIGLLAKSNDFGKSWQKIDDIYQGSFFDLARTLDGNLMVVGLRGNVYRSTDNGNSWLNIPTKTTALLNGIVKNEERFYILGNAGVLLISDDNGSTFTQNIEPDGKSLISGVIFQDKLFVTSENGVKLIETK